MAQPLRFNTYLLKYQLIQHRTEMSKMIQV